MLGEQVSDSERDESSIIYSNDSVELDNHMQATIIITYWTVNDIVSIIVILLC